MVSALGLEPRTLGLKVRGSEVRKRLRVDGPKKCIGIIKGEMLSDVQRDCRVVEVTQCRIR